MAAGSSAARQSAGGLVYSSDNIHHLCRKEIPGGGQIVIQGQYAYVGHQHGPDGTTILDISDPRNPRIVSKLMTSHPWSHSHKVRVLDDLMVVNSEIEPGAGDRLAYPDGGFRIYHIRDRTNPKLLAFVKTHARGAHRFDLDENYAFISTEMDGFVGNILVIYDIGNPTKPDQHATESSNCNIDQIRCFGMARPCGNGEIVPKKSGKEKTCARSKQNC